MSKEHAYAYEAGYRDGSIHYELEHCPACKNVADLQEALAENAKLRELVGMIGNVCDGTSEVCEYCKNYSATNDECMMLKQMRELGVEVNG